MGENSRHEQARQRAEALLQQMTLREKVGQLNQRLYGFRIYERKGEEFTLTEEFRQEVERFGGLGTLYGLYRADPWADKDETTGITPELSAKAYNLVQRYVLEHSRLGIPMMLSTECPHGHQALGGGLLPVNLALGASFAPQLVREAYEACGRQLASGHVDLALMSLLDIVRDPRWGRSEECYSEDPYLAASLAGEAVKGMQSAGVGCVAKHFCAQGETTGGVNASAARIGEHELREIHLPAAKACVDAGVAGIMAAYNEIDGVYCHANEWLLRDVLRGEMGFDGVIMADGLAIDFLKAVETDTVRSGAAALRAGVDISLWDEAYSRLEEAIEQGLVSEKLLDEAVLRVLTMKYERGLFEHPYMEEPMCSSEAAGIDEKSLELAVQSAVLLKNEEQADQKPILPLGEQCKKIAVIGYHGMDHYCQLGDYTPPVDKARACTVAEGMKLLAGEGRQVTYAPGSGFSQRDEEELEKAVALAKESDVVIAVLGGSSSRFGGAVFDENGAAKTGFASAMDCGEGMDLCSLQIPQAQQELFERLAKTGTPIVTVLLAGRAYAIGEIAEKSQALLYAFYPGPWGGKAIAELLYGMREPSGRLPVSVPVSVGQLPVCYNGKASAVHRYSDNDGKPLFSFGEGFGYVTLAVENARLEQKDGGFTITAHVKNEAERTGCAVLQVYIHRLAGPYAPRVRELKGFEKVTLQPGESREVVLEVTAETLAQPKNGGGSLPWRGGLEIMLEDSGKTIAAFETTF